MTTSIRTGSRHDIGSCVDLWTQAITARDGKEAAADIADKARAAFAEPLVRFAIAGATPQGFALTISRHPGIALLSRICVDPSITSHGLGMALVADAIQHARDAGFEHIRLDVRESNVRAIALYARAGFVAVSEPWKYDSSDSVVTWSLDLAVQAHSTPYSR